LKNKHSLLCGYVPAVEASLLLEGKKEGTYLIRFSKTQPGSFAVTFVDNVGKIKHCLLYAVNPSGLTLKSPPTVYSSLKVKFFFFLVLFFFLQQQQKKTNSTIGFR